MVAHGIDADEEAFAYLPVFLLFFIVGLKRRNYLYSVLAVLFSFLLSTALVSVSYILTSWLLVSLYLIYYLKKNSTKKKDIIFSITWSIEKGLNK